MPLAAAVPSTKAMTDKAAGAGRATGGKLVANAEIDDGGRNGAARQPCLPSRFEPDPGRGKIAPPSPFWRAPGKLAGRHFDSLAPGAPE